MCVFRKYLPKPEAPVTTEVTITQEDPCTEMVASSESPCVSSENNLPKPEAPVTTEVTITQEDPCTEMVASSESPCVSEVLLSETVFCRGILCSGLTPVQLKETWMVASENDVQYYREFSPCVTHVVVHTDPVRIATRTVKYFFAIANHCWILDYKWIEDSKQAGHLLPKEDYEIIGDSTTGTKIQRPKASRMTGSSLLTGYEIYCDEKSSKDIDTVTMTKLLLECGGTVARSLSDFSNKHVKQLIVTCTEDDDVTPEDVEKYTEIHMKTGIVTVVRDWVFDSLSLYSVQPLDEYKFTAEENMSEDDENDASDKDSEMDFFGCGDDDEKDPDYADLESESKEEEEYLSDSSRISELFPVQSVSKSVEALRKKRANIITEKEQKPLTVDPYSATGIDPVRVQASKNKDGIRIWDKIHYCMYCGEGFTNITKHYLGPHKQEMEVQRILSLPLKSEKRKLALMKHRNSGDYKHNVEVLKNGTGTLVT
ncbi:breast cancer type 1 susceptibility protein homolog [Ylistrum balloti]|uniref:breast cancer type 1 susceptibility protein homolog n=1 Tax=Ylistrum balloti TaxID=509963 RepID=UPI002905C864|nr:breast cancer type 1 susceptibility protein homolog [Ylistrum balloti]